MGGVCDKIEERLLYPAVRDRLTAKPQQDLRLILNDQQEERDVIRHWQRLLDTWDGGEVPPAVTDVIESLGQLIKRHLVLQEQRLLPVVDGLLSAGERAELLRRMAEHEARQFAPALRRRYERLLAYLEQRFIAQTGRVW